MRSKEGAAHWNGEFFQDFKSRLQDGKGSLLCWMWDGIEDSAMQQVEQ
jgi:hypothetical protein